MHRVRSMCAARVLNIQRETIDTANVHAPESNQGSRLWMTRCSNAVVSVTNYASATCIRTPEENERGLNPLTLMRLLRFPTLGSIGHWHIFHVPSVHRSVPARRKCRISRRKDFLPSRKIYIYQFRYAPGARKRLTVCRIVCTIFVYVKFRRFSHRFIRLSSLFFRGLTWKICHARRHQLAG